MELEQLKSIQKRVVSTILAKTVDPLGTEEEIARSALKGMRRMRIAERMIEIPGITRNEDLIMQMLADFRAIQEKNYMPTQYAKADDIVMEPLRPAAFSLDNFKLTTDAATPALNNVIPRGADPAVHTLIKDERYIITDIIELSNQEGLLEHEFTVDGTVQFPISGRLHVKGTDLKIFELDNPILVDVSLNWNGRSETASVEIEPTPVGVHLTLGQYVKTLAAGA